MPKTYITLAIQLREAVDRFCKGEGKTREALAESAGIEPSVLSRFMRGENITLRNADNLARVLGIRFTQKEPRK